MIRASRTKAEIAAIRPVLRQYAVRIHDHSQLADAAEHERLGGSVSHTAFSGRILAVLAQIGSEDNNF
jgi:hypothetical protein